MSNSMFPIKYAFQMTDALNADFQRDMGIRNAIVSYNFHYSLPKSNLFPPLVNTGCPFCIQKFESWDDDFVEIDDEPAYNNTLHEDPTGPNIADCPISNDFNSLNNLLTDLDTGFPAVLSAANDYIQTFLQFPLKGIDGKYYTVCPTYGHEYYPQEFVTSYVNLYGKFNTFADRLIPLLEDILSNKQQLTNEYAKLIGPISQMKDSFLQYANKNTSINGQGMGIGDLTDRLAILYKYWDGTTYVVVLKNLSTFFNSITAVYNTLNHVNQTYMDICNPPTPVSSASTKPIELLRGKPARICRCPMKKVFCKWRDILYPKEGSDPLPLNNLNNLLSSLQYAVASSLTSTQCSYDYIGLNTIGVDYSSMKPLIDNITLESRSLLEPFIDGINMISSNPADFCLEDVKEFISQANGPISQINDTINKLPSLLTNPPYWVNANKDLNDASNNFVTFFNAITNAVSLYFKHCKEG